MPTTTSTRRPLARHAAQAAFTLVELLLVVAILGILATVVAVNVAGHGDKARRETTRQSIAAIETAVRMYEVANGSFPDNLDQLTVGTDEVAAPLRKDRLNDAWGTQFQYKKVGKVSYEIRSAGPDQSFGTQDDLTN